jgi:NADPH:quinone reductase
MTVASKSRTSWRWEEVQVGKPGPGEARVRNTAVGPNYVDTYVRSREPRTPQFDP